MYREMLKAKIHKAKVTEADLNYEGSITIDEALLEAVGMFPYEKVQVLNISNGTRAETYIIPGNRNSGDIVMNGAIARLAQVGDCIIILAYVHIDEELAGKIKPSIIVLDDNNRIISSNKKDV